MHPKEVLLKSLKSICRDIRSNLVGVIIAGVLLSGGGIVAFSKTALNYTIRMLNIPTPLWVTIVLVLLLCGSYIYLKPAKRRSSKFSSKIRYFTIGKHKWKTTIYQDGQFTVDEIPLCAVHDLPFIYYDSFYTCPDDAKQQCRSSIHRNQHYELFEIAKSYIDKKVRDHDY